MVKGPIYLCPSLFPEEHIFAFTICTLLRVRFPSVLELVHVMRLSYTRSLNNMSCDAVFLILQITHSHCFKWADKTGLLHIVSTTALFANFVWNKLLNSGLIPHSRNSVEMQHSLEETKEHVPEVISARVLNPLYCNKTKWQNKSQQSTNTSWPWANLLRKYAFHFICWFFQQIFLFATFNFTILPLKISVVWLCSSTAILASSSPGFCWQIF